MSNEKRCDCCKRYWYFDDLVSGLCPNCLDVLATKNQISIEQDQKIKDLEHRLSNCIEPKFNTYQQVYIIVTHYTSTNRIPEYEIFDGYYYVAENENEIIVGWNYKKDFSQRKYWYIRKDWVFATEEEARKHLEELKK